MSVAAASGQAPVLDPLDLTTFDVLPSLQDNAILTQWNDVNASLTSQLQAIASQIPSGPTLTPAQSALQQQGNVLATRILANTQRSLTGNFAYASENSSIALAMRTEAWWYADSPLLIAASTKVSHNSDGTVSTLNFGFDLLKDDVQVLPYPGQSLTEATAYRIDRGVLESYLEGQFFAAFGASLNPGPGVTATVPGSATDILAAAAAQNIPLVGITQTTIGTVASLLVFRPMRRARILTAVGAGAVVVVPTQAVNFGGLMQTGWLELQLDGTTSGVLENGDHGITEYDFVVSRNQALNPETQAAWGFFAGFLTGALLDASELILLNAIALNGCPNQPLYSCFKFSVTAANLASAAIGQALSALTGLIAGIVLRAGPAGLGFQAGLATATNGFTVAGILARLLGDPPLPQLLLYGTLPPAPSPGASPGVTASLTLDPNITYPLGSSPLDSNDAQIPTVFDAYITNTGPSADTFNLALTNPPAGFTLVGSLPTITIPAGAQALINVCAIPTSALPPEGTNDSFNFTATSAGNGSVTSTTSGNFTVPAISAAALSGTPTAATTTPGTPVNVTVTIAGTGNQTTLVALSAATDPDLEP